MHTWPGTALGTFGIRPGPLLAAADRFTIEIAGKGAHAMAPHTSVDPVVVAAHTITALQTHRVAQHQSAGGGGGLDLHGARGRRVQHHSRARHADRHGADAERKRARHRAGAPHGAGAGNGGGLRRDRVGQLRARRSGDHERSRQDQARRAGRPRGGGRPPTCATTCRPPWARRTSPTCSRSGRAPTS